MSDATVAVVADVGVGEDTYRVVGDGETAITTGSGGGYACVTVVAEDEVDRAVEILEDKFNRTLTEDTGA